MTGSVTLSDREKRWGGGDSGVSGDVGVSDARVEQEMDQWTSYLDDDMWDADDDDEVSTYEPR